MKQLWKEIINNSVLLFAARIVAKLATVGVMIVLARILGADSFGTLSGILALSVFAGLLSDFGLVLPTIRAISGHVEGTREILQGTFTIRVMGGAIGLAAVFLGGIWLDLPFYFVLLLGISSVLESLATAIARSFEGRKEIRMLTYYVVSERAIYAVVVITTVLVFHSLESVVLAHIVAYAISLSVAFAMFTGRVGSLTLSFSLVGIRSYVRTGAPLLLTSIVSTLFYKTDILLLSHFRPHAETGLYNAAFRLIDAQMFIPMTLMVTIFPTLSKMHFDRNDEFFHVFRRSLLLLLSIGIGAMLVLVFLGSILIRLLYTEEYKQSVQVLQILAIMLPFYFVNYLLSQSLVAIHEEAIFSKIMIVAAMFSVCLNIVIVPSFGYIGSAWIRVVGEVIAFVSFLIAFKLKIRALRKADRTVDSTMVAYD